MAGETIVDERPAAAEAAPAQDAIALCLSGGGLRATLFHFGLVKALRQHEKSGRDALRSVTEIYSVSGGSILAAHLVKNWPAYVGSDDLADLEAELLDFARLNIRDRVIRRWMLFGWLGKGRTHWLRKQYERLVGTGTLADCYEGAEQPPRLEILATSFKTGELCAISRDTFQLVTRAPDGSLTTASTSGDTLSLAFAVAASSAFPPMFPPVELDPVALGKPDAPFDETFFLSDGGVYDNFGVEKFRLTMADRETQPDLLLISNAGGSFRADGGRTYSGMFSRNIRASDIMMRRVGENTEASVGGLSVKGFGPIKALAVKISEPIEDRELASSTQRLLRLVRTDLDRFDDSLARLLVDHGYRVGAAKLVEAGWTLSQSAEAVPAKPRSRAGDPHVIAERGSERSFRSLLLDLRDWTTTALWTVILAVVGGALVIGYLAITARAEAEAAREFERAKQLTDQANTLEAVRQAYSTGDMDKIGLTLGVAIRNTEKLASDPSLEHRAQSRYISQSEWETIIEDPNRIRVPAQSRPHDQRVFIQFAGSYTRAQITELNEALKGAGWNVQGPSGERTPNADGLKQIRYSGGNLEAARDLAAALAAARIVPGTIEVKELSIIGANDLEVWMSN